MPWNQPGSGGQFGFVPYSAGYGELIQVNFYNVSTSEATQIFPGDVIAMTTLGGAMTRMVRAMSSAAGTLPILGVAAAGLAVGAGSSAATIALNSSALLPVYDSPDQLFFANDTTSGLIGSTGSYHNVQFSATNAGSTAANRSGMMIAGNTASSNSAFPFKLMGIHPLEIISGLYSSAAPGTGASTDVRKFIVKPLNHIYGQAGLDVLTT